MTPFQIDLTVSITVLIAVAVVAVCVFLGIIASRAERVRHCNCADCQKMQNDPIELDQRLNG